jgi:NitT/TauT family transport system substrate-binding protein
MKIMAIPSAIVLALFFQITNPYAAAGPGDPDRSLRVALLPILDSLPFHVAEEKGFFARRGIDVKAVPVASAIERDQLMQSDRIDGMLTELNTTAVFNRDMVRIRIVRYARISYPDYPLFRVLAAPDSGIRTASDLAGVGIGIAKNTVIEYVTDRLLAARGLKPEQVVKQSVPVIPERFQLLLQGRIKAAVLPDPLAKSAMISGAIEVVADSEHPQYGVSVLAFRAETLRLKGESLKLFLQAWDDAAEWINEHPEESRAVLLRRIPMPENVRSTYRIPPFPRNGVPTREQWRDVILWMKERGLLEVPVSYEDSVTGEFLGKPAPPAPR